MACILWRNCDYLLWCFEKSWFEHLGLSTLHVLLKGLSCWNMFCHPKYGCCWHLHMDWRHSIETIYCFPVHLYSPHTHTHTPTCTKTKLKPATAMGVGEDKVDPTWWATMPPETTCKIHSKLLKYPLITTVVCCGNYYFLKIKICFEQKEWRTKPKRIKNKEQTNQNKSIPTGIG